MDYVAIKAVNLSGHRYMPGENIPYEHVLPSRKRALIRNERIAEVEKPAAAEYAAEGLSAGWEAGTIPVPVPMQENGRDAQDICLMMQPEDILAAIRIMQTTPVEIAAKAVEEIHNEDILILLDSAESRQGVKKAARRQAEKLTGKQAAAQEG